MSIVYRLDGALLPFESVRFNPEAGAAFPSTAWYCEANIAGVIIEDQSGTLDIGGWHTFTVEETACSKPRIFTGWITGKKISRGRDSNRVGAARVWNCDIIDQNALFLFETFRSTAASVRPEETDVARIQAMIVSHAMAGTPIVDNGRLSTDNPLNLSAANFVAQYPADMAMATAGQCAKNVYAYWDDAADEIAIHYDAVGDGPAATISFSNVASDVNSTTVFAPSRDAVLTQDPYALYTGYLLGWTGGWTYDRNDDLIDDLSPTEFSPINFLRDKVEQSSRIGRATTANTYLQSQLARAGVEKVTLTFSAILPASVVNLAHAGDVATVRFSHLPGFTSNTEVAILKRSVRPVDGHDSLYEVTFDCANFAGASAGGGGGGPFPPSAECEAHTATVVQSGSADVSTTTFDFTLSATPTAGNTLILWFGFSTLTDELTPVGFDPITDYIPMEQPDQQDFRGRAWIRHVQAGDTDTITCTNFGNNPNAVQYIELSGELNPAVVDTVNRGDLGCSSPVNDLECGDVTAPTSSIFLVGGFVWGNNVNVATSATADAPATERADRTGTSRPSMWLGSRAVSSASGVYAIAADCTFSGCLRGYVSFLVALNCTGGEELPPLPGQDVNGETPTGTVDGVNDEFTSANPFRTGTLFVSMNGSSLEAGVDFTETDNSTVTFTRPPPADAQIVIRYEGL